MGWGRARASFGLGEVGWGGWSGMGWVGTGGVGWCRVG